MIWQAFGLGVSSVCNLSTSTASDSQSKQGHWLHCPIESYPMGSTIQEGMPAQEGNYGDNWAHTAQAAPWGAGPLQHASYPQPAAPMPMPMPLPIASGRQVSPCLCHALRTHWNMTSTRSQIRCCSLGVKRLLYCTRDSLGQRHVRGGE